ncbi:hypothetical protein AALH30_23235 [Blautia pseudococcoides]|nr:hypothetical protein [Blautia pseudococcoides]MCR2020027.1 hypothetical protein [Blautia pseudococcoides]QJU14233.1 hypothetical protein HL650_07005 [Blautia pseudococcoides]
MGGKRQGRQRLHTLMGFENALCAMLTDPDEVGAFYDRLADLKSGAA